MTSENSAITAGDLSGNVTVKPKRLKPGKLAVRVVFVPVADVDERMQRVFDLLLRYFPNGQTKNVERKTGEQK